MNAGKEKYVDIFAKLGDRLTRFGSDGESMAAIANAVAENPWFTEYDIRNAIEAIRLTMLAPDSLEDWLAKYDIDFTDKQVAVIAAGNIPLVGFFDILCVLCCGYSCYYKPSSKDAVLFYYIKSLLADIEPGVKLYEYSDELTYDAVIATGGESANRYFRERFTAVPALLRGSRSSMAVLSGSETDTQLAALSKDIFMYSGLGCRNVSLIFVPDGYNVAALAEALSPEYVNPKYTNAYRQSKAVLAMNDARFIDGGSFLMTEYKVFSDSICRINYAFYSDIAEVEGFAAKHDEGLQCVVSEVIAHPRATKFGKAQYPALCDYPDGQDVISFLLNA